MECVVVPATDLSREHRALWSDFLCLNMGLDGPAFQPEFVCGLAQYIPDCKIAILHQGSNVVGYLPFSAIGRQRVARAIPMCDYQAIIGVPDILWDMREVLRSAGLRSWIFQNLPQDQIPRQATYLSTSFSPRIHLKDGFEAYRAELAAAGKSARHILDNIKRLERSHGPISLNHNVADEVVLSRLLRLKAERFAPNGRFPDWVDKTLTYFHRRTTGPVAGLLSVMKASDKYVAYLFSLKADDLLYYWFPTFEPQFQKYSPGLIMLWSLIRDLNALNCSKIDLGPGNEPYKEYFANRWVKIASGRLDANESVAGARRFCRYIEQRVRSSTAAEKWIKPIVRKLRGKSSSRPVPNMHHACP
jgi:CelD/BcsL family acetyltransferase involved in cellulose biosynthesis